MQLILFHRGLECFSKFDQFSDYPEFVRCFKKAENTEEKAAVILAQLFFVNLRHDDQLSTWHGLDRTFEAYLQGSVWSRYKQKLNYYDQQHKHVFDANSPEEYDSFEDDYYAELDGNTAADRAFCVALAEEITANAKLADKYQLSILTCPDSLDSFLEFLEHNPDGGFVAFGVSDEMLQDNNDEDDDDDY